MLPTLASRTTPSLLVFLQSQPKVSNLSSPAIGTESPTLQGAQLLARQCIMLTCSIYLGFFFCLLSFLFFLFLIPIQMLLL